MFGTTTRRLSQLCPDGRPPSTRVDPPRQSSVGRFDADMKVHSTPDSLLAAQASFRRLHRNTAEQKLNLLQLTSRGVAEPRTRPPEVLGREFGNTCLPRDFLHRMRNGLLRESVSPNSARLVDPPEQPAAVDICCSKPFIDLPPARFPIRLNFLHTLSPLPPENIWKVAARVCNRLESRGGAGLASSLLIL